MGHDAPDPATLLDALGINAHSRVTMIGIQDEGFWTLMRQRVTELSDGVPLDDCDLIFLGAEERRDLKLLTPLQDFLKPTGAIWVVRPQGAAEITDQDVVDMVNLAGLTDTTVVRFSATHTADRLVMPVEPA